MDFLKFLTNGQKRIDVLRKSILNEPKHKNMVLVHSTILITLHVNEDDDVLINTNPFEPQILSFEQADKLTGLNMLGQPVYAISLHEYLNRAEKHLINVKDDVISGMN